MDKALELIMVAVILVVASVVIISMLQGQTESFGDFANGQTNSSNCGLSELEYERNLDCSVPTEGPAASTIETRASNNGCSWATSGATASDYC